MATTLSRRPAHRPAVGGTASVVGFAGCDSVESGEVVSHWLVADRGGTVNPGLHAVASIAALNDESRPKRTRGKCLMDDTHWVTGALVSRLQPPSMIDEI